MSEDRYTSTQTAEDIPDSSPPETHEESWQQEAGLAADKNFEKFSTVGDLAKSYTEAQGMISRSVRFPTEDASEERVTEFQDKILAHDDGLMRVPEGYITPPVDANGYTFEQVEGANIDADTEGAFKSVANTLGLTQAQANGVHQWLGGNIADSQNSAREANERGMADLKGQWGQATEQKLSQAENIVVTLADDIPGLTSMLDGLAATGHDAVGIALMSKVAEMMGEAGASPATHRTLLSPEDADAQLLDLNNKYEGLQQGDLGWQAYQDKKMQLYRAGGKLARHAHTGEY